MNNKKSNVIKVQELFDGNMTNYIYTHKNYKYDNIKFDSDKWVFVTNNTSINFDETGCNTLYPVGLPNWFMNFGDVALSEFYGLWYILSLNHESEYISFNHYRRFINADEINQEWFEKNEIITFGYYDYTFITGLTYWFKDDIISWIEQLLKKLKCNINPNDKMHSHNALFVLKSKDATKLRDFIYDTIGDFCNYYNIHNKQDMLKTNISKHKNERLLGYIGEYAIQLYEQIYNTEHKINKLIDM